MVGGPALLGMARMVWGVVMTIEELCEAFTDKELAAMWVQLNRFEWPATLPRENPSTPNAIEEMVLIERAIGRRACLAEWNRSRL